MDTNTLNTFQDTVHSGSLMLLGIVLIVMMVAAFRPQFFRKLLNEFSERKYILSAGVFAVLLCSTVFVATQPNTKPIHVSENTKQAIPDTSPLQPSQNKPSQDIKTEEVGVIDTVAYPKEKRDDAMLLTGKTKLVQAGKNGQRLRVYSVTYYDGKEVTRTLKNETVTINPTPEITAVGTKAINNGSANNPRHNSHQNNSNTKRSVLPKIQLSCPKGQSGNSSSALFNICLYRN